MANTMANKKHSKRKFVAVALGLVGIAGLSVASAATLNVEAANEVAIGTGTFEACADAAYVDYSYGSDFTITSLDVTNITGGDCDGQAIEVILKDAGGAELASGTSTVASAAATIDVSAASIDVETDLGDVIVVISPKN